MKKLQLVLLFLATLFSINAQDVIVKKDGTTILCRIYEVNGTDIVYKKWSDLNGDKYIMDRSIVSVINYQDGRQDKLNEPTVNSYAPGNQQTGAAQYNDNALLALDNSRKIKSVSPKVKTLRIVGWTVGSVLFVGGGVLIYHGADIENPGIIATGTILAAGGIATTTGCLIKAHKLQQQNQFLASTSLIQHEFNISKDNSLITSVDVIQNKYNRQSILGLGLQFNF